MSFIVQEPSTFLNIKLTDHGRAAASAGNLRVDGVLVLDREIDYSIDNGNNYDILNNRILDIPHYYPDTTLSNFDNSSIFNEQDFTYTTEKIAITSTTSSSSVSTQRRGTATLSYGSNSGNWGKNQITFGAASLQVGDIVFVPWVSPEYTGSYSMAALQQNVPAMVQAYKIISAHTAPTYYVDRPIPNFAGSASLTCEFFYDNLIDGYIGTSKSTDPGIWNLNIVRTGTEIGSVILSSATVSGYTTYGSIEYNGTKHFFGFGKRVDGAEKPDLRRLGFIHYSNKYTGNTYAEQFVERTFELNMPTIMWHHGYKAYYNNNTSILFNSYNSSGTTWGLYLSDYFGETYYDEYSKSTYRLLYDGRNSGSTSVGRVYHKLKMVLITDQELLTALTYKSNRNYTLPDFNASLSVTPQTGLYPASLFTGNTPFTALTVNGLVTYGYDYFVTYIAKSKPYAANQSIGNPPSMPCGYVKQIFGINDDEGNPHFLKIDFPNPDSFPFMRDENSLTLGTYDSGWNANEIQILVNRQESINGYTPATVPYDGWIALSGQGIYTGSSTTTINPRFLNSQSIIVSLEDYDNGTPFSLFSGITDNQNYLTFGDECFLYGTVNTGIQSTVFKTNINLRLKDDVLNGTSNNTFDIEKDNNTYITEVVAMQGTKVVAAGKPTYPIRKNNTRYLSLRLDIDF